MRTRAATYLRFLAVFAVLGTLGLASSAYLLIKQRAPNPFRDTYTIKAMFTEADGVIAGIGQPVNVAGVKVGQVTGARLADGKALVTMELRREQLPHVYADASAILDPITPLKDMQIALSPGRPPARALTDGATIAVDHTQTPVPLADLLSNLDADTRTFLSSLISSLDQGTRGRADDLRRALATFGPTAAQVGRISHAVARRRVQLSRLVHNVAVVTNAASRDGQLARSWLPATGRLARSRARERPFRDALAQLPGTLRVTESTLSRLGPFADELRPTLHALLPGVRRLPATLRQVRPFTALAERTLRRDVRPHVRGARPLVRQTSPTVANLVATAQHLTSATRSFLYFLNELAYNPPGDDEGFLFWLPWAAHNVSSAFDPADAHGNIIRATRIVDCDGLQDNEQLQKILGVAGLCPH